MTSHAHLWIAVSSDISSKRSSCVTFELGGASDCGGGIACIANHNESHEPSSKLLYASQDAAKFGIPVQCTTRTLVCEQWWGIFVVSRAGMAYDIVKSMHYRENSKTKPFQLSKFHSHPLTYRD